MPLSHCDQQLVSWLANSPTGAVWVVLDSCVEAFDTTNATDILPSRFLLRDQKSEHPFGPREHT